MDDCEGRPGTDGGSMTATAISVLCPEERELLEQYAKQFFKPNQDSAVLVTKGKAFC